MWHGHAVSAAHGAVRLKSCSPTVSLPMFMYNLSASHAQPRPGHHLRFSGRKAGPHALAVTAVTFLLTLPDAVAYVLYPQLVKRYREALDNPSLIRDLVERAVRVLAIVTPARHRLSLLRRRGGAAPRFREGVPRSGSMLQRRRAGAGNRLDRPMTLGLRSCWFQSRS
jgi:hypothetical protein